MGAFPIAVYIASSIICGLVIVVMADRDEVPFFVVLLI